MLFFNVRIKEFKEVCKIVKQLNCKLKIRSKKGLPFLMYKYQK